MFVQCNGKNIHPSLCHRSHAKTAIATAINTSWQSSFHLVLDMVSLVSKGYPEHPYILGYQIPPPSTIADVAGQYCCAQCRTIYYYL